MKTIIAPSILSADFGHLNEEIVAAAKASADWIHLDIMDGHFVPTITFGPGVVAAARKVTTLPLDAHLMVTNPEDQIEPLAKAGADIITIHVEATSHLHRLLQRIHELGKKAGVALNPATAISTLENIISDVEMVLLMTVNPGWGGQKYIETMDSKIKSVAELIKATGKKIDLQVDGGINNETTKRVKALGANVLVSGSYIFESNDYKQRIDSLR